MLESNIIQSGIEKGITTLQNLDKSKIQLQLIGTLKITINQFNIFSHGKKKKVKRERYAQL
jgi:hypothetical protein